jgi:hypothetical protein
VIEELLPVLYPGHRLSYGKIWQWVAEAERAAEQFNRQASLSAIEAGALDELFARPLLEPRHPCGRAASLPRCFRERE